MNRVILSIAVAAVAASTPIVAFSAQGEVTKPPSVPSYEQTQGHRGINAERAPTVRHDRFYSADIGGGGSVNWRRITPPHNQTLTVQPPDSNNS